MFGASKALVLEVTMSLSAAALYYLMSENVFVANKTNGESMEPTIEDTASVVCDKFSYAILGRRVKKGDIIIS